MPFKILNGTPKSGRSLCLSCANMARRTGQNGEDEIHCASYDFGDRSLVTFKVAECTAYRPFNQATLKSMHEMAWIIQPKKKGQTGFGQSKEIEIVPPKEKKGRTDFDDVDI